jgi:alkylhydroperoxidase/carboxymuconolactone decarboxylase family protein YurZ
MVLTRLALNDEVFVECLLEQGTVRPRASALDGRTSALVRLGALLALDAAPASYSSQVAMALASGATEDEIVEVLVAVTPSIGAARAVSAAPELALALGFDVDVMLEQPPDHEPKGASPR